MIINEKILKKFFKGKEGATTLYLNNSSINSFSLKQNFIYLEFLSLQNNSISDIRFLKALPNLWYLDIRNNPIDNYDILNITNILGFLALSVERYHEKKVLSLRKMNIGIINLNLDDNDKKVFLSNNPNIIRYNDQILYFYERLYPTTSSNNSSNITSPLKIPTYSYNSNSKNMTTTFRLESGSLHARNLVNFFNKFNQEVLSFELKEALVSNLSYIHEERKKIILLFKIFESIYNLNRYVNKMFILNKDTASMIPFQSLQDIFFDKNDLIENPFYSNLIEFSNLFLSEKASQIVILSVLILNILSVLGKEFSVTILKYIFKSNKVFNIDDNQIKAFLEVEKIYLLGLFYEIYDKFMSRNEKYKSKTDTQKTISQFDLTITDQPQVEQGNTLNLKFPKNKYTISCEPLSQNPQESKYEEIIKCLEMSKIILKANCLNLLMEESQKIYNLKNDLKTRKQKINTSLITIFQDLSIFDEILILLQFINDFLLFHKIDLKMVQDHTFQYRVFVEIKELMFTQFNKKYDFSGNTLIDRKYTEMKYKRFGNKLFFIKNPPSSEKDRNQTKTAFANGVTILKNENIQRSVCEEDQTLLPVPKIKSLYIKKKTKNKIRTKILEEEEIFSEQFEKLKRSLNVTSFTNANLNSFNNTKIYCNAKSSTIEDKGYTTDSFPIFEFENLTKTNKLEKLKSSGEEKTQFIKTKPLLENPVLSSKIKIFKKRPNIQYHNRLKLSSIKTNYNNNSSNPNISNVKPAYSLRDLKSLKAHNKTLSRHIEPEVSEEKNDTVDNFPSILSSPKKINFSSLSNKTIYNFNMNIKKLTHHWNSNNPHIKNANNKVKENEFIKIFKNKAKIPINYTTADEIYNLFSIENKNEIIKNQVYDFRNRKYTMKSKAKDV